MKKPKKLSIDQHFKEIVEMASRQGVSIILLISTEARPDDYLLIMHGYSPCLANLLLKASQENDNLRKVLVRVIADLKISGL